MRGQAALQRGDLWPADQRQDVIVGDDQVVELDEHRRPLHRIEFLFGLFVNLVIFLVLPARDVAPLPLVFLGGGLPR